MFKPVCLKNLLSLLAFCCRWQRLVERASRSTSWERVSTECAGFVSRCCTHDPLNTLCDDVSQSKELIFACAATSESCLFLFSLVSILARRILQKTLDGIDSSVMPRHWLSQLWRSLFLVILTIRPLVQSSGIASVSQMSLKRSVRTLLEVPRSAFSISLRLSRSSCFGWHAGPQPQ